MIFNTKTKVHITCLLLASLISINAQQLEQISPAAELDRINQQLDINTKAQELGISAEQLQEILNSASGNIEEDPQPDAMQEAFLTGAAAGDLFGYSVSTAGDVNGDGYSDIIVGAIGNDAGGAEAGRAYIYFGGNVFNNIADVILTGSAAGDQFGTSVSTAGDVNGDGYSDVIVGANLNDAGGTNAGRAYIYFGGAVMDNIADVILTGAAVSDQFGISVSTAEDVNGDGYSDVIVGAHLNDAGGTNAGRAYIFFGGTIMDNLADVILTGAAAGDQFGISNSTAGDVNGDGYSDVIVGANLNDEGGTNAGRAYIYFGGSNMDNLIDIKLTGSAANDAFGISVSSAGDVNGDGYSDVIVGANGNDAGGNNAGRAYIYFGSVNMNEIADVVLTGVAANDAFGISVSAAGDINGDGYSDVSVGAYFNDAAATDAGRAYVYFGGVNMDNIADIILTGAAANDRFGYSVSTAGDFNGDGNSDIIVGAFNNDTGGNNAGRAYLYTVSSTGSDIPYEFFTGEGSEDHFGYSVSSAGDVNGDGYSDFIVGAYGNDSGGSNTGRAYIFFGGVGINNIPNIILNGQSSEDGFGISVCTAGDVNGDGYSDVIVGAFGNDAGGGAAGRAYLYLGGSIMDNTADVILTGAAAADFFGYSVSTAGDVNGDGYSDVIVGAYGNDAGGVNAGRAYIYFGGVSMDNTADVILTGAASNDEYGWSVSTAGDVNSDGYSDVIVGAYLNDAGGTNAGRAYIYFGGAFMDNLADVILTGETSGDYFGWSVSTSGDVNSDGYSDVIVGAPYNDNGGVNAGRAYIYFGGSPMNNVADVIITGQTPADYLGISVSLAGNVNGDGYSDVIVGAPYSSAGGTDAGRAYIYFGGSSMDNIADIIMTGIAAGDNFGYSVCSAGDVNSDGYSDVLIGSIDNDAGGTDAGRAYLYVSSSLPYKPRIASVKDVPNDQGGYVLVKFYRSYLDGVGVNSISGYAIEMSRPPVAGNYDWIQLGTVLPQRNLSYTYLAHTLYDSSLTNNNTFYFRVTAVTNQNELLRSNIAYGYSIDNLSPAAPLNFYAALQGSNVKLGWKANTEPDFRNYHIYRSDTPVESFNFNEGLRESDSPDALTLIGTTADTTFIDTSPLVGNAYYYIQAYDVHDNGSPYSSDSVMAYLSANIRVLLEGSYDAGGIMRTSLNLAGYIPLIQPYSTSPWNYTGTETVTTVPANVTDWVLVELRSTTTTVVDRRAAFIKNDGTLVDLDGVSNIKFPTATAGDYYVVIIHRNHLSVMTANPITISFNPTLYDMRTDLSKAYGTNAMKSLGGGYYGMYTSDTDGNGTINATDRSNTWNQRNLSGYYGTDVDLSGTVNASDRSSVWNNRNLSTQVPASGDAPEGQGILIKTE